MYFPFAVQYTTVVYNDNGQIIRLQLFLVLLLLLLLFSFAV